MPELPDITVYLEALERRVVARELRKVRLNTLFVLRTARPPIDTLIGRRVTELRRLGKRIVFGFDGPDELWLVMHLMVAGRLQWQPAEAGTKESAAKAKTKTKTPVKTPGGKHVLATFEFEGGTLVFTEAGTTKRASLHVVAGAAGLAQHEPGGADVFAISEAEFAAALAERNRTVKRVLTDPRVFSGIGNAYSDEILHAARLSPLKLTGALTADETARLLEAIRETLTTWTERLRAEAGEGFPTGVTAFRPEMAVHGKFGQPCPVCGKKVQRIRYADNETNYCPICQTGGKLLADRSLSRLLKGDWPKQAEE